MLATFVYNDLPLGVDAKSMCLDLRFFFVESCTRTNAKHGTPNNALQELRNGKVGRSHLQRRSARCDFHSAILDGDSVLLEARDGVLRLKLFYICRQLHYSAVCGVLQ